MPKSTLVKELSIQFTKLLSDPDYVSFVRSHHSQTFIGSYVSLFETQLVSMLTWYLDPQEGHLQGDYFIKRLLSAYFENCNQDDFSSVALEVLSSSYSNMFASTEVVLPSDRRIDLLLSDATNKTLIIIERKDGTKAKNGQLQAYREWAESNFKDWKKLYILSDSHELDHGEEYDDAYIKISDEWLITAINDVVAIDDITSHTKHTFCQTISLLSTDGYEYNNDKMWCKTARKLSYKYSQLLTRLEKEKITCNNKLYSLLEISPTIYLTQILPGLNDDKWLVHLDFIQFIQQHHYYFESLACFSEFEVFEENIIKTVPQGIELDFSYKKNSISFSHEPHCINENEFWPYYMKLTKLSQDIGEEIFQLSVAINKDSHDDAHKYIDLIRNQYDINIRSNWKFREKIILSDLKKLSLTGGTALKCELDKFFRLIIKNDRV